MTIQEALKSGLPFRRPDFKEWFVVKGGNYQTVPSDGRNYSEIGPEDILANDWEVLNKPKVFYMLVNSMGGINRVLKTETDAVLSQQSFETIMKVIEVRD